jgi:RNA polymerase sigma-70 factor, ECF subfamily
LEEKDLISKCIHRNARAHKLLFEKYHRKMYYVALRYLSNKEDAEDALTEAFIRILNKIGSFRYQGEGSLTKWIKTIVINESLRALTKKKRLVYQEDLKEVNIETDDDIEGNIDMEYLLSLVQSMPDGYKIVFNLYVVENYTHNEISELLGITVSTSKSQLYKARNYLMLQLKKQKIYEAERN